MTEWFKGLDPVVQAAIIGGVATVGGVLIKGVIDLITNKNKNDIPANNTMHQNNSGDNTTNIGELNQDGSGNVQNTYINCNIQPTAQPQDNNDFDEKMEKYMAEHTITSEDIDKMFDDVETLDDGTTEEYDITPLPNAVMVRMKNLAGGDTVIIGDEKSITKQIIKEHNKDIEKALSEL